MAHTAESNLTNPLTGDEVPKIDNALAIGEDLTFQERWWKFEHAIWVFFLLILIADVAGVFGRGWFAKARLNVPDSGILVDYERVARASTPSVMRVLPMPASIQNGTMQLYVSESLIKEFGAQRISPQPQRSVLGNGGVTYTFPATDTNSEVQFALESSFPGVHTFTLQVPGRQPVSARVVVVP